MSDLIILGHGPTRYKCPYDCETWGVNNTYSFAPRLDRLFILDQINSEEFDYGALERVAKQGTRIVTSVDYPEHPEWNLMPYPINEVIEWSKSTYFSNAICYMIALALYEREVKGRQLDRLLLYGIDMTTTSTYLFERPGVDYWCGIGHARGVNIVIPKESATGKAVDGKLYGYWGEGKDNTISHGRACAEELQRFLDNFRANSKQDPVVDPDGHSDAKARKLAQMIQQY